MEPSGQKELPDLESLQAEAAALARTLAPHESHATLVTLSGELGAGKTSFTQGIARELGIEEAVTSPTFVLEKIYELTDKAFKRLVHIDAYRLEGETSLVPLGWEDLYADPANLIVLEWPELVASQLAPADRRITLSVEGEGRLIS
jgi:tRNA threonylcarbamoyladenosine biosynthesis protein TsaE